MAPQVRSAGCHAQRCTRVSPLAGEPGYTYWGWPDQGGAELLRREGKGWRLDYALVGGAYGGRGVQGQRADCIPCVALHSLLSHGQSVPAVVTRCCAGRTQVSRQLLGAVRECRPLQEVKGSDHCPVLLALGPGGGEAV